MKMLGPSPTCSGLASCLEQRQRDLLLWAWVLKVAAQNHQRARPGQQARCHAVACQGLWVIIIYMSVASQRLGLSRRWGGTLERSRMLKR